MPVSFSVMPVAGTASATSAPTDSTRVTAGYFSAGRRTVDQNPDRPPPDAPAWREADNRHRKGMRGRSTQRPSFASSAGRTVSEPSTATATTVMEPTASDEKMASLASSMPAIEIITATPDTTTACPDVAAAISTASRCPAPLARSSRSRRR